MDQQPDQQPQQPQQAPAQPQQPAQAPTPDQPKKSKKGLIIGLSIGGAVVLIAIIAIVVLALTVWAGPSKEDYTQAKNSVASASDDYQSIGSKLTTLIYSARYSSDLSQSKSSLGDSVNRYKSDLAKVEESNVLKDKDFKKSYDDFKQKSDKMLAFVSSIQASADSFANFSKECSNSSSDYGNAKSPDEILSKYDELIKPCADATNQLKNSQNQELAKFAKDYGDILTNNRSILAKAVEAAKAGDRDKVLDYQSELSTSLTKLSTLQSNLRTSINDRVDSIKVGDQLSSLENQLSQKASE